jgi:hypothetical protein
MRRTTLLPIVLITILAVSLRADDKTKPSKPTDDQIRAMLKNLDSEKSADREKARTDLMGLPGDSLEDLRRIVTTDPPPLPAVAAGLHDVVEHLFLKREGYTPIGARGQPVQWMLGIPRPSDSPGSPGMEEPPRVGVPMTGLMPGLPSYQFLREGDLVTGIYVDETMPMSKSTPVKPTPTWKAFQEAVDLCRSPSFTGGKVPPVVEMQLLRNGESIRVAVPMTPRMADDDDTLTSRDTFIAARAERADRYWHEKFAVPLKLVRAE